MASQTATWTLRLSPQELEAIRREYRRWLSAWLSLGQKPISFNRFCVMRLMGEEI